MVAPSAAGAAEDASVSGVSVISQAVVGPYATVQLQSTDPNALSAWLTANGYAIPSDVQPIIATYVNEKFDFLALRLAPGQGVKAMRPVSVTTPGAGLSLPLRMVAAGTGPTVGITLWVVGDGRYEPKNFQSFVVSPSELVWDWNANDSNYAALRSQKEYALNDAGWQIESSLSLSPFSVENTVLYGASDYVDTPASDAGPGETAYQARQRDLATLFPSGQATVHVTRMRSDLAHAALVDDLVVGASVDQTELSNVYQVTQSVNAPQCPSPPVCPCGPSGGIVGAGIAPGDSGGASASPGDSGDASAPRDDGGGESTTGAASPPSSGPSGVTARGGGCALSSSSSDGAGFALALAGLAGMAVVRARSKKPS